MYPCIMYRNRVPPSRKHQSNVSPRSRAKPQSTTAWRRNLRDRPPVGHTLTLTHIYYYDAARSYFGRGAPYCLSDPGSWWKQTLPTTRTNSQIEWDRYLSKNTRNGEADIPHGQLALVSAMSKIPERKRSVTFEVAGAI